MKLGNIEWDEKTEEGVVVFTTDFITAHRVLQLDALVDCIHALQNTYDQMLSSGRKND